MNTKPAHIPPGFRRLDAIKNRADALLVLAVDACRKERWAAYKWLIREYRRKRLFWEDLANKNLVADDKRAQEWDSSPNGYSTYLDRCRETFGLTVRHRLEPLPGEAERKSAFLDEMDRELEEHCAKFDPFYIPKPSSSPAGAQSKTLAPHAISPSASRDVSPNAENPSTAIIKADAKTHCKEACRTGNFPKAY